MEIGETISAALSWLQEKILGPSTTFRMHMDADRDGAVDNDWRGLEN